jgi:hypothetical protein
MTKNLLAIGLLLAAGTASAQITTYVLQPASLEGALEFTWADAWGSTPDLNDPANVIQEFTAVVRDATAADSLGCETIVNTAAVAGKIAMVYRGACEFGLKSLNAQNAGAIGVVIINNQGAPVGMGGGAVGDQVNIPVVMISTQAGADLRSEVDAGNVEMLIGSVFGLFPYNLSINKKTALIPQFGALPKLLAQNANEFNVTMGTWVKNFGSEAQSGVTVTGTITENGSVVYSQTSNAVSIASGDSAFVTLPLYSQNGYDGYYEGTYTINSPFMDQDGFPADDAYSFNFLIDELYTYAPVDEATSEPISTDHYRAGGGAPNFMQCIAFRNANASRVKVEGMFGSAAKGGGGSIDGEVLEARLIEWNDNFTGIAGATFNNLVTLDVADYFYVENINQEMIYVPFNAPYTLENNRRYLFCLFSPATDVFLGFNTNVDHTRNELAFDQPMFPGNDNGQWFAGGFGSDIVSANGVRMVSSAVGIDELDRVEITPYPNPANDIIRIPVGGLTGKATLEIFNAAGAKVADRQVAIGGDQILNVNVNDIPAGVYLFNMNFEGGKRSSFRVVVTK